MGLLGDTNSFMMKKRPWDRKVPFFIIQEKSLLEVV